jgi:CHAD domain-containing protein
MPAEVSDFEFGRTVVMERAEVLLEEFAGLQRRPTEKAVHDTRVQSRRLRAALEAFEDMFPPLPFRKLYDSVRGITRTLGRPRETGVLIGLLHGLAQAGDMADNVCLEYLTERTERKLRKLNKELARALAGIDPVRFRSQVHFLLAAMEPYGLARAVPRTALRSARGPARRRRRAACQPSLFPLDERALDRAGPILCRCAGELAESRAAQRFRSASDEELHSLRIAAKKLRYAMEIFESLFPSGLNNQIQRVRALQDAGGDFHDWCVLCEHLKTEIRRLDSRGKAHMVFQIGRLLAYGEDRRTELRLRILPALAAVQEMLPDLLAGVVPADHAAVFAQEGKRMERPPKVGTVPHAPGAHPMTHEKATDR